MIKRILMLLIEVITLIACNGISKLDVEPTELQPKQGKLNKEDPNDKPIMYEGEIISDGLDSRGETGILYFVPNSEIKAIIKDYSREGEESLGLYYIDNTVLEDLLGEKGIYKIQGVS